MTVLRRRIMVRSLLVILWIVLGILIFIMNRGHTLLVDNKADGSYEAVDLMVVTVNDGKPLEFFRGDRDKFPVAGLNHHIRIEFTDGRQPEERTFMLPIRHDMYILSVPKMLAGADPFVEPFSSEPERRSDDAEPTNFQFTSAPSQEGAEEETLPSPLAP